MKKLISLLLSLSLLTACLTVSAELVLPDASASTLTVIDYPLPDGEYEVYYGPGTQYVKADLPRCGTDGEVAVLQTYDGWLLVVYRVSDTQEAFGWIRPETFADPDLYTGMDVLEGTVKDGTLLADTAMTDDPLLSLHTELVLPAGTEIQVLAVMGEWLYVRPLETEQNALGFIRTDNVRFTSWLDDLSAEALTLTASDGQVWQVTAVDKALENDYFQDAEAENANYALADALTLAVQAVTSGYGVSSADLTAGSFEYGYRLNPDNVWLTGSYWQFDFSDPHSYGGQYEVIISGLDGSVLYLCGPGEGNG